MTVRGRVRGTFYLNIAPKILLFRHDEHLLKTLHHRSNTTAEHDPDDARIDDTALTASATFDHPDEHKGENRVGVVFLFEVLPFANDDAKSAEIILGRDQDAKFRRIGYFDFEWVNAVWSGLYNLRSRDHDERRQRFGKEAPENCSMEGITIL